MIISLPQVRHWNWLKNMLNNWLQPLVGCFLCASAALSPWFRPGGSQIKQTPPVYPDPMGPITIQSRGIPRIWLENSGNPQFVTILKTKNAIRCANTSVVKLSQAEFHAEIYKRN